MTRGAVVDAPRDNRHYARVSDEPNDDKRLVDSIKTGVSAAVESVVGSVVSNLRELELPGARVRRVRRQGHQPLPSLWALYPEAHEAHPLDIGLRSIDVDAIRGTAVAGSDQRGGDFLPLKPFRGSNWAGRWNRLRQANERLESLPPIDVVKYDGGFWVTDGHNRVALAKYVGQDVIDASVVELVPRGGRRTEPLGELGPILEANRAGRVHIDDRAS
jgi:hypothetical protein